MNKEPFDLSPPEDPSTAAPAKKKRGRPPKDPVANEQRKQTKVPGRKRGRPKKNPSGTTALFPVNVVKHKLVVDSG
ncbi:hypothetical protein EON65_53130 [archaeon]|nr:MAG: hypothetical protein EON65_53130 [archaeon]